MFQSLVITLREGVEAALIVGIVLGHLKKTGREAWSRIVFWALGAAILASLAGAYAIHRLEVDQEALEGWLMMAGAIFVASMAIWMWKTGKRLKQEIEAQLARISTRPSSMATLGLFLFVFLMVFREGVETVLFLAAVSFRTTELLNFLGGAIGLALAVGLGVAFFKGTLKVNLRKFFAVTTLVLLVVATQLLVAGIHELSEARILPSGPREMALIGPVVNNDAFFFVVVVALALFLMVAQRIQASASAVDAANSAAPERRKLLAEQRRERFWKIAATAVATLVIIAISTEFIYSKASQSITPAEAVSITDGEVRVPVSRLADHRLHRFAAQVGGATVRFIALLDASDTVRAGLDACLICGSQGYYQDGANVICRHCSAAIYAPTIGMAGGCNPIHIDYRLEGETLIISESALRESAKYFP
ncbi:MAG: Fe-S-containing protein [Terriglobia bacterium]